MANHVRRTGPFASGQDFLSGVFMQRILFEPARFRARLADKCQVAR